MKCIVLIKTNRINQTKICNVHSNAHKLKKIVYMNADNSETIKDRAFGFQISIPWPCTHHKFVT